MVTEIKNDNGTAVALLKGEIDHHNAKSLRAELDHYIVPVPPERFAIDFGGITFMDSSGIGLVMGRYRVLQKRHAQIDIINVSPQIRKVMQLSGIGKLARIEPAGGEDKKYENPKSV